MNKWKVAFFVLLASILGVFIAGMVLINILFSGVDEEHYTPKQPVEKEASFLVQTNKEKLNTLISTLIVENARDTPYMVELLSDRVEFRSSIRMLGSSVPVTLEFHPNVSQNGDLLLEVKTFSVGLLQLPVNHVMNLVHNWIEFPEWVVVYPSEQMVEVKVTDIRIEEEERMVFKIVSFDLKEDKIELEVIYE